MTESTHTDAAGPHGARQRRAHRPRGLRTPLPLFQFTLMCAVKRRGKDAYGVMLEDDLILDYGLDVDLAQVYVTAHRLEKLGHLAVRTEHREGVGRPVKVYRVTEKGDAALASTATLLNTLLASIGEQSNAPPKSSPATQKKTSKTPRRLRPRTSP